LPSSKNHLPRLPSISTCLPSHTWYGIRGTPFRFRLSTCSPSFGVLNVAEVVPVRRTWTDVLVAPDHLSVTC
jgi:hypothetical protein